MKYFVILTIIGISLLYSHLPDAESRTVSPLSITLEDNTVKQNSFITGDGRIVITIQKEQTVSFPLKVTQSRHDSLPVYFPHSVEYAIPDTRKSILPDMKIEFEPFNMILKPNVPQILNVTITTMNYTQLGEHRVTLTAQYPQGEPLLNTGFDVLVVNETQYENLNSNSKYPVPGGGIISDIYPVKKQFEMGIKLENLKCNEGLVLIQKYDRTPACVTESTKQKLIERGWTGTMVLNDNQKKIGSYLKQVEILDENYVRMSMSYPTNDANHEIYPDDYQSIVSGCTEQNNTATLSLLYLQKIDTIQNQMIFRQENKTFDGLQCDEALWQEMTEWGYCGPPRPLIFNTESLVSSIIEAQNRTDLMLDLPQYLPSGYSIQKITVESDGKSAMLYISQKPVTNEMPACEFTWNDEGIFLFYSKPTENFDWDTKYVKYAEDPKKQLVTINGNPGYVEDHWVGDRFGMPIPQQSKVVWYVNANDEIIEIHSSLSGEELIKVAESLEVKK